MSIIVRNTLFFKGSFLQINQTLTYSKRLVKNLPKNFNIVENYSNICGCQQRHNYYKSYNVKFNT